MKKLLFLLPLLASCAPHPQTVSQTVYCLTPAQYKQLVDAEPKKIGNTLDPDARKSNEQLVKQNILVRAYADGLLEVLGGCVK